MKILVAPDSFKGSLSAVYICNIVEEVVLELAPTSEVIKLPMADGGEGTVDCLLEAMNGSKIELEVANPLGESVYAYYGIFDNKAIIEMAAASGLPLVKSNKRDVSKSNTYGTGELILDAIKRGATTIYLGIGGSATNDCGIGCLHALGVNFLDENGSTVKPIPANFTQIVTIDTSSIEKALTQVKFVIMCDVKNPLLGVNGATYTYGEQKGITKTKLQEFEEGMEHIARLIELEMAVSITTKEGCGAAGGLGAGLLAFTNASMQSGVDTILEVLQLKEKLKGVDLVITGEGQMDRQSTFGKVAYGVGSLCKTEDIPCVALVGGLGEGYEDMYSHGITSIMTTTDRIMTIAEAIENAESLCRKATYRMLNMIQIHLQ